MQANNPCLNAVSGCTNTIAKRGHTLCQDCLDKRKNHQESESEIDSQEKIIGELSAKLKLYEMRDLEYDQIKIDNKRLYAENVKLKDKIDLLNKLRST
jgi:hypothetical protein